MIQMLSPQRDREPRWRASAVLGVAVAMIVVGLVLWGTRSFEDNAETLSGAISQPVGSESFPADHTQQFPPCDSDSDSVRFHVDVDDAVFVCGSGGWEHVIDAMPSEIEGRPGVTYSEPR